MRSAHLMRTSQRDPRYLEALHRIQRLLKRARRSGLHEPTAMALATSDAQGRPTIRTVLLKGVDERGFVFYTNLESRKGRQLREHPRAALCWYWDPLREQVTVEGAVARLSDEEADAYWVSRPRLTQLGAWASLQSRPLASRTRLQARLTHYQQRFSGRVVPRPLSWSGFRVMPDRIEFWTARPFRLNERVLYAKHGTRWLISLLYP